jgi:hypothetical protein
MRAIRDTPRAIALMIIGILAAMAAVAILVDRPYQADQLVLGIGFASAALLILLAARQGVRVEAGGVRLQYVFRSRFVPWEEVVCFKVATIRNLFGERLAKPAILLRQGNPVPVPGASRFSLFQRNAYAMDFPVIDNLEAHRRDRPGSGRD